MICVLPTKNCGYDLKAIEDLIPLLGDLFKYWLPYSAPITSTFLKILNKHFEKNSIHSIHRFELGITLYSYTDIRNIGTLASPLLLHAAKSISYILEPNPHDRFHKIDTQFTRNVFNGFYMFIKNHL